MALTLEQLIKLANLSEDVKKDALANIASMNEDQKFRFSQICWESIARQYEARARLELERMLEEMANGEKEYSPEDFAQIEDKMLTELLKVIQGINTEEQLGEAKEELKKHLNNPLQK